MRTSLLPSFLLASAVFLFSECKKDDNTPPASAGNYSPLTVGSSWTYSSSENGSAATTNTVTVTDKDTAVNGRSYKVLINSNGSDNVYETKQDSNYYRFSSFAELGNLEELYLKDNRPVNVPWTNVVSFTLPGTGPVTANLVYNIAEKGIAYKVNGKDYNNVIHVVVKVNVIIADIGGGDFYYADGIGLIESKINVALTGAGGYTSTQQLVSNIIK